MEDTPENIANMIMAMDLQHMLLCVEGSGQRLETAADEICVYAKNLKKAEALNQNGDLVAEAKESNGVILAVEIGETSYAEIERELEISRMQDVDVKGFVVVS